ncbi:MAG: hypothetical protein CMF48_04185 [Legionellales bacterium]|nr:hypothetical protein [Legionellales bacterium]|tara:strand:- start:359 stop:901 length:543 start_codon:yes stop_codon:yes gene_type:complete
MRSDNATPPPFHLSVDFDGTGLSFKIRKRRQWTSFDSRQLGLWLSGVIVGALAAGLAFVFWPAAVAAGVIALGLLIGAAVDLALNKPGKSPEPSQDAHVREALIEPITRFASTMGHRPPKADFDPRQEALQMTNPRVATIFSRPPTHHPEAALAATQEQHTDAPAAKEEHSDHSNRAQPG